MLAQFLQTDPVGYEDDLNLYAYTRNEPINSIDDTGLSSSCSGSRIGAAEGSICGGSAYDLSYLSEDAKPAEPDGDPNGEVQPIADIPPPPEGIEGGPWTPQSGQPDGVYQGPRQPRGPRTTLRWVPPESEGGPPGSQGYWKRQHPDQRGYDRFDQRGRFMTPDEAHPNPRPRPPPFMFLFRFPIAPFIILPPEVECQLLKCDQVA